ncbi:MAG: ribonuclease H-like domain-containing protein [Pirellulales bacterium]
MLNDEIRARIAGLQAGNRNDSVRPLAAAHAARSAQWQVIGAALPQRSEECCNSSGAHLRFRQPLTQLWPQADSWLSRAAPAGNNQPQHPELAALAQSFPRDALLLDLETCGFAGSMVFLAGLVWCDGVPVIDQLFARTYAEERALLETVWQIARHKRVLVTFNGKSFDWPMVRDRSTRHRLGAEPRLGHHDSAPADAPRGEPPDARVNSQLPDWIHCDLLHHARRRWKGVLPDCRLQTLERFICRRARHDDLPGALVPQVYHEFVRTGRADRLGDILRHNAFDLVTLAQLACRLITPPAAAPVAKRA